MKAEFSPIGILRSPFREKFGIPRQPGLAPHAMSRLVLLPEFSSAACVDGLEGFSHLWLLFLFHGTAAQGWQPSVRPPRLGGNARRGVFATRSMFRPNPVGLSAVELVGIVDGLHGKELLLRGADLLDGTPILDIKPYIPYADARPDARAGFAPVAPTTLPVHWTENAQAQAGALQLSGDLRCLIAEVLAQDPRPAYRHDSEDNNEYGVWLDTVNVRFCCRDGVMQVLAVEPR
ncbi:MAG TPA: tRNA (N6-threonylcarbamoyladenosine(37)-N6)-methyltransferase TrmO [Pseudomonadales bacterium]|nr:tRNA (N6-threonylcarbamoyladenosine(37)-N6)-methyltransferase TrmO [Pseudomonadales bacterium]